MVVANPRNIRAAEKFREQRVREMMESRAAARITTSSRRFIRQRSRISEFRFEETSDNFQTAELALPADMFEWTRDSHGLTRFLSTKPSYRSYRVFLTYTSRNGEQHVVSSKVTDTPEGNDYIETDAQRLIDTASARYQITVDLITVHFAQRIGGKCESR
jgi:hypothetical protein